MACNTRITLFNTKDHKGNCNISSTFKVVLDIKDHQAKPIKTKGDNYRVSLVIIKPMISTYKSCPMPKLKPQKKIIIR
jgi:hypothetical protein